MLHTKGDFTKGCVTLKSEGENDVFFVISCKHGSTVCHSVTKKHYCSLCLLGSNHSLFSLGELGDHDVHYLHTRETVCTAQLTVTVSLALT